MHLFATSEKPHQTLISPRALGDPKVKHGVGNHEHAISFYILRLPIIQESFNQITTSDGRDVLENSN